MVFYSQLLVEISECIVVKLLSINRDEDSRDSEATNDVLPDKVLDFFLSDNG